MTRVQQKVIIYTENNSKKIFTSAVADSMVRMHCNSLHADRTLDCNRTAGETLPKRGDAIIGRECVYKEAGSAVQFPGIFDFFPNCCTGLFSGTGQTALFLAVGGKLLFLYVLECEVYPADPGNDDCNVGLRQADPQVRQVEEAAFDILPCVQPWGSVFL